MIMRIRRLDRASGALGGPNDDRVLLIYPLFFISRAREDQRPDRPFVVKHTRSPFISTYPAVIAFSTRRRM